MLNIASKQLILVDAESAFDVMNIASGEISEVDPFNIARELRQVMSQYDQKINVVFVIKSSHETENENLIEFSRKETQLAKFFGTGYEIATQIAAEKTVNNMYVNMLARKNVKVRDAAYVTALEEVDAHVQSAGIENIFRPALKIA